MCRHLIYFFVFLSIFFESGLFYFIVIFWDRLGVAMAQAIRSLGKMIQKLQQTFKTIQYYTARQLALSKRYGAQYANEYAKISNQVKKASLKDSSKRKKKYKDEKDHLKKKLTEVKQHNQKKKLLKEKEKEKKEKYFDSDSSVSRQRSRSSSRSMERKESCYLDRVRPREKDKREIIEEKRVQKRREQEERQKNKYRNLDLDRDFDYKKPKQPKNNDYSIYEEQQSRIENQRRKSKRVTSKWSDKKPQTLGCQDLDKYKILTVDQQCSDFEDDDAPLKVPMIKPRQPLTPYFLFIRFNRYSMKGYIKGKESTQLREIWKKLTPEQKKPYEDEYQRAQQVYGKKLVQYHAVNPRNVEQKNKTRQQIQEVTNKEKDEHQNKTYAKSKQKTKKQPKPPKTQKKPPLNRSASLKQPKKKQKTKDDDQD